MVHSFTSKQGSTAAPGFLSIFQEASSTPLDISVEGSSPVSLAEGDFVYGLVAGGSYTITAKSGATTKAVGTVKVASGSSVTAMVYLVPPIAGPRIPPNPRYHISGFVNDQSLPATGYSRVVLRNTAASTSGLDVYVDGKLVAPSLTNDPSSPTNVTLTVPEGPIKVVVTPADDPGTILTQVKGVLVAGDLLNVFVVGGPTDFGLLTNAIPLGSGYRMYASDGGVFNYGTANYFGSLGSLHLNKPIVAASPTAFNTGYWMAASDGGVFAFGAAGFFGSHGGSPLNKPVVGMASTPDDGGYWLVASDGGIFSYGDAKFYGSHGGSPLNEPIVAMATTPDGGGYWLVAADGGIFTYGDAQFYGSTGNIHLNSPIVAILPTVDGGGYWLVAADGGVFTFGNAYYYGSMGGSHLNQPIVAAVSTPDSLGYRLIASDGGIFSFGDAHYFGSHGGSPLNEPIVYGSAPGSPLPT